MITNELPAYGLWSLVILNAAVFILFAFSFTKPQTKRDWRSFGAFSAFIVALFAEMYGFPLTIYLFSGWLAQRYPQLDLFSHDAGHLWATLFGFQGDPHLSILHLASKLLIAAGFLVIGQAWSVLYQAQKRNRLAVAGPYRFVRHPQYGGFLLIILGFFLQWPTLLTLLMLPVLITMYLRLARTEEQEMLAAFGSRYQHYLKATPRFFPRLLR